MKDLKKDPQRKKKRHERRFNVRRETFISTNVRLESARQERRATGREEKEKEKEGEKVNMVCLIYAASLRMETP